MNLKLQVFLLIILVFFLILNVKKLKSKKISIRYGSFSILLILFFMLSVCIPKFYFCLANFLGFETPANMLFLFTVFLMFYIIFTLLNTISQLNDKVKKLIQEVSLLKNNNKM